MNRRNLFDIGFGKIAGYAGIRTDCGLTETGPPIQGGRSNSGYPLVLRVYYDLDLDLKLDPNLLDNTSPIERQFR